jgi:diguanylate cyclase (GGDEF)-like protein
VKKILALILAGALLYLLGFWFAHHRHAARRAAEMDAVTRVIDSRPAKSRPDYALLEAVHAQSRDLVFSMVLDRENNPVLFGHVQDPRLKAFLSANAAVSGMITDFERDPSAYMRTTPRRSVRDPRWGRFTSAALAFNDSRLFLLFLENSLRKDLLLLALAAAAYAAGLLVLSAVILRRSIPSTVRKIRRTSARTDGERDDPYGHRLMVDEQLEQLSFFREITLATNTIGEIGPMMKSLLSIFAMRFPEHEVVFYLPEVPGDDILRPSHGLVAGATLERGELEASGLAGGTIDGFVRELESEGAKERVLVPLKDGDSYLGFIALKGPPPGEKGTQDLNAVSRQIAMAVKNSVLHHESITDGLTGLHVHRYFQLMIEQEIRRFQRLGRTFALVLMDIDDFKAVNDTRGHPAGDAVLNGLAVLLKNACRSSDVAFRYGGEEFALLLPETDLTAAFQTAERIRTAVEQNSFVYQETVIRLTLSLGMAAVRQGETKEELVKRCDAALYRAKLEGKNRSVIGE